MLVFFLRKIDKKLVMVYVRGNYYNNNNTSVVLWKRITSNKKYVTGKCTFYIIKKGQIAIFVVLKRCSRKIVMWGNSLSQW